VVSVPRWGSDRVTLLQKKKKLSISKKIINKNTLANRVKTNIICTFLVQNPRASPSSSSRSAFYNRRYRMIITSYHFVLTHPPTHPHPTTRVCNPRDAIYRATFPRRNRCFNQYTELRFAHDIPRTIRNLKPYTAPTCSHPDMGSIKTRTSSY